MLVSELITWCNDIWEPDETSYETSDSKWIRFFNEGISQCRDYVVIEREALTDIVVGTSKYALPDGCIDLKRLYISDDDGETYYQMNHRDVYYNLGEYDYFIHNNEINIYEPIADVTNGLKLYYYKEYDEITATTDTIESTDNYVLGYYALSRVAMQYNRDTEYERFYSEFLERRSELDSREVMPSTEIEEGW